MLSGLSPDARLVEIVELADHPWFVGTQFHPEFKSRPNRPHPLFRDFLGASIAHKAAREGQLFSMNDFLEGVPGAEEALSPEVVSS